MKVSEAISILSSIDEDADLIIMFDDDYGATIDAITSDGVSSALIVLGKDLT